jgi:hypothetical protein
MELIWCIGIALALYAGLRQRGSWVAFRSRPFVVVLLWTIVGEVPF